MVFANARFYDMFVSRIVHGDKEMLLLSRMRISLREKRCCKKYRLSAGEYDPQAESLHLFSERTVVCSLCLQDEAQLPLKVNG